MTVRPTVSLAPEFDVQVDVYPVGVLDTLQTVYQWTRHGHVADARHKLCWYVRFWQLWTNRGAWNGYLAEPLDHSVKFTRAGHGWTRRRALADLRRHLREATRTNA